ncbi:MAG: hypothetical protein N4A33_10145 [Bacteriovoracaceae bacterium]|jgi:hypothetical protein|nr:hypothetical protein [Bacteriovoracaceae bacterium]
MAFLAGGGTLEDFIRSGGLCSKNHSKLKDVRQYIKNNEEKIKSECKLVREIKPLKADLVIKREKQCETVSDIMIRRLSGLKINLIQLVNYSEFCEPKRLIIKAYCCS